MISGGKNPVSMPPVGTCREAAVQKRYRGSFGSLDFLTRRLSSCPRIPASKFQTGYCLQDDRGEAGHVQADL